MKFVSNKKKISVPKLQACLLFLVYQIQNAIAFIRNKDILPNEVMCENGHCMKLYVGKKLSGDVI